MFDALVNITEFLWGTPLMILMVGVGLYLSARTGFFQITGFGTVCKKTLGEVFKKDNESEKGEGQLKPYQALSTVLAGTIGSGNIAGVAAAIAIGGPGAVFWMWVIALVGMMTKMAEVTLSVAYRKKGENGEYYGGPMHYIKEGQDGFSAAFMRWLFLYWWLRMPALCRPTRWLHLPRTHLASRWLSAASSWLP